MTLTACVAAAGAAAAVLGVLATTWWVSRDSPVDFGWYAYPARSGIPRRYVDFAPPDSPVHWWSLLTPAAIAGAVAALLVLGAFRMVLRARHGGRRAG